MKDKEIRSILIEYLSIRHKEYRIFQEKSIGSSICDLMLVTDKLTGFEIKSDNDNYERLGRQVKAYNQFFDENYIVVGKSHVQFIEGKVPFEWGILCVDKSEIKQIRQARGNQIVSRRKQLSILWKLELKNILIENALPSYALKDKDFIIDKIDRSVADITLQKQIVSELLSRDYSLFNAEDYTIKSYGDISQEEENFPVGELADRLSEEDLSEFTLDKWMNIYKQAMERREQKGLAERDRKVEKVEHKITYKDIDVALGVPWVSLDIVLDFVSEIFKVTDPRAVSYEPVTGHWSTSRQMYLEKEVNSIYGLPTYNALRILEAILNVREIKIYDGTKYNEGCTLAVLEKQKLIEEAFANWVWQDEDRIWEIEDAYNRMFAGCEIKSYDGSGLSFPEMDSGIQLYDYQKNAVQKIISTPNTLLSFDVGSGKTYIMIAAAEKLKELGISEKNLFVVPNNIVGQWEKMFTTLYPKAKVLAVEPKSFTPDKRQKVLRQIKDGGYDGIIMAYSCFEMIPLSQSYIMGQMQKNISEFESELKKYSGTASVNMTPLENEKKYISKLVGDFIKNLTAQKADDITFDELGVNTLFVDEAHNYKNIPIRTSLKNLRGINVSGSDKCFDMLQKVRYVQNTNGGRGVVFATGTPLANSISDAYNMQMYLQYNELKEWHLDRFDNWVKTFAKVETVCEIDVDTKGFRMVRRFSKFINLPELSRLFACISVFYAMDDKDIPAVCDYSDCVIERSAALADYMNELYERTEKIRQREVARDVDNMLMVSTDGRKAALHLQLVGREQAYDCHSKVYHCVNNVIEIYKNYPNCTQLIFCDYSTPKGQKFNVYSEIKSRLVGLGVPPKEIAFVHSYTTEEAKMELYNDVNCGKVRVLIGSTFKLGIGANVQSKLKAIHHIDVPWRPADMVQREGRILRRGNENDEVFIYRYIVEGSFDAYSWQILEIKQKFISQFLSGTEYQRTVEDLENQELTYAQVKALALSQPLMKEYTEKLNYLRTARIVLHKEAEIKEGCKKQITELKENVAKYKERYAETLENKKYADTLKLTDRKEEINNCARAITNKLFGEPCEKIAELFEFVITTPMQQSQKKPCVIISRLGAEYAVEVSDSVAGNVTRLKHFLQGFEKMLANISDAIKDAENKICELKNGLAIPTETKDKVTRLEREVEELFNKIKKSE